MTTEALIALANQQQALDDEVATLEETLKSKEAQLRELSENQIREARDAVLDAQRDLAEKITELEDELTEVQIHRATLGEGDEAELGNTDHQLEQLASQIKTLTDKRLVYDDDSITLPDGRRIVFKQGYFLDLPKKDSEKRAVCLGHLKEIGAENLCAHRFTIDFPKGAEVEAHRFAAQLQRVWPEHPIEVTGIPDDSALKDAVKAMFEQFPTAKHYNEWSINAQTLKAWAAKRIKAGHKIPDEFGLYAPVRVTVVAADAE